MNQEHRNILSCGVGCWNAWLKENPDIEPDLSWVDLAGFELVGVDFSCTKMIGAQLRGVNLRDVNLSGAYLRDVNLSGAYLRDANLSGADLSGANLRNANLRDANLRDANLSGANLSGANLSGVHLLGANLLGANLYSNKIRRFLSLGPIGSRKDNLVVFLMEDDELIFNVGCWMEPEEKLLAKVEKNYGDNEHSKAYREAVSFAKTLFVVKAESSSLRKHSKKVHDPNSGERSS